jgi:cytosine/adenosine deaminase-related metal-dependent hydrolase
MRHIAATRERGQPMHIHAAQSMGEHQEIVRRHGAPPIERLERMGALGPDTINGHRIFFNDHPWLHRPQRDDVTRLRASGYGVALNRLSRYMRAGIPSGMGNDAYPHDMFDELRLGCHAGRTIDELAPRVFEMRS